jgi:hypothetical protein
VHLEIPKEIQDLLRGKRVALVGPSPHLVGKGIGYKIDDYDIVCRVNDIIDPNFAKDYGSKNDIIFHSCPTLYIDDFEFKLKRDYNVTRNIKFVICTSIKAIHDGSGSVVDNFNKINKWNIPFWWIEKENYWLLRNLVGVEANSGIMAMLILIACNVEELLITGFSFYHQHHEKGKYIDCYYNKSFSLNHKNILNDDNKK